MPCDISSLGFEELRDLENQIKARKVELRSQELTRDKLKEMCVPLFDKRFPPNKYKFSTRYGEPIPYSENLKDLFPTDVAVDACNRSSESIIKLCDIALGNYHVTEWRTGVNQSQALRLGNRIPSDIAKDYEAMFRDIWAVFEKYSAIYDEKEKMAND